MTATPMAHDAPTGATVAVRTITTADLNAALAEGYADFMAKRGDLVLIGMLYALIGIVTAIATQGTSILPLLFPLLAGLSLLGPLAATGFYEMARRREAGQETSWWHFFDVRKSASLEAILVVALLLIAIFGAWLVSAGLVYGAFFGVEPPASLDAFLRDTLTTPRGWGMIVVGNLIGLAFAIVVLTVSVTSLPMLIDRRVDAGTAIGTSIRAVRANPRVMARWGLTVAVLLVLGSIPAFLGLAVVLPVLGYATWHLYTKVVVRDGLPLA